MEVRTWQIASAELEAVSLSHVQIVYAEIIGTKFSTDESQISCAYFACCEDSRFRQNLAGGVRSRCSQCAYDML